MSQLNIYHATVNIMIFLKFFIIFLIINTTFCQRNAYAYGEYDPDYYPEECILKEEPEEIWKHKNLQVCGSNKITYKSLNELKCSQKYGHKVELSYLGRCSNYNQCWLSADPELPSNNDTFVRTTNGYILPNYEIYSCYKTYKDKSILERLGSLIPRNYSALRNERDTDVIRPDFINPCDLVDAVAIREICGTDNTTYKNIYALKCTASRYNKTDSILFRHEGECKIECPYSPFYQPVCSNHGVPFSNIEALNCKSLMQSYAEIEHDPNNQECYLEPPITLCYPDIEPSPVCLTDKRTFQHINHVQCLKRHIKSLFDIKVAHKGPCKLFEIKNYPRDFVCQMASISYEWNPVCATNNITYPNPYVYYCLAMGNETMYKNVTIHQGECGAQKICKLMKDRAKNSTKRKVPVCGNNGVTYKEYKNLICAKTRKPLKSNEHIVLKHFGECDDSDKPCMQAKYYTGFERPVCGTDGKTYISIEALWCEESKLSTTAEGNAITLFVFPCW